jgi:hypothetical protein
LGIHRFTCGEYLLDLKELILGRFLEITGVKVGLKASLWKPFPKPILEDIDEEWAEIKPISALKSFQNKNYSVFSSNIERGSIFLSNHL